MGKLQRLIDSEIKQGDLVKLVDGSGLTDELGKKLYIIHEYEEITGSSQKLEDIEWIVDEVGIDDIICDDYVPTARKIYYIQDIVVTNGICKLRTASKLVKKI
jgi:hypothetical protein